MNRTRSRCTRAAALLALCAVLFAPVVHGDDPEPPPDPLERARALEAAQEFEQAAALYRDLVASDDEVAIEARFQLGRLALTRGHFEEAIGMLEAFQRTAGDIAPPAQLRDAGEWLDEAHAQRTTEWVTALERRDADPEAAFVFGRRLVNTGRLDDALRVLAPLAEQSPEDPQVQYWLGQALLRTRHFDQALAHLAQSVALAPDNIGLLLELGRAHAIAGESEHAERIFREVAETAPDAPVAEEARRQLALVQDEGNLLRRAIAMEEADRPERAERLYRGLLEAGDAEGMEARFLLGRLLLRRERFDEAIEMLETYRQTAREAAPPERIRQAGELLDQAYTRRAADWVTALAEREADPQVDPGEAFVFGRRLVNTGRLDDALRLLTPLAERLPEDAQVQYWLGQALLRTRQFDQALVHLERSVTLAPDNFALQLELGQAYETAGARGRAEQIFQEIDDRAPETPMAQEARRRLNLGRADRLIEARDWAGALEIYTGLLADHPDDPQLLGRQARVFEELGRDEELDRVLQRLIAHSPRDIDLLLRSAGSFERRGRIPQAQQLYIRILALQVDGEAARFALGRLGFGQGVELIREGQYQQALQLFEQLHEVAPRAPLVNLNLGLANHGLQRHDEAEAAYLRVIEQDPRNLGAWVQLGQLYEETVRRAEAIDALEVAFGFADTPRQTQLVRARLNALYAQEVDRLLEEVTQDEVAVEDVVALGRTLFQRQFDAEVVRLVEPMLVRAPDDPQLHFWFGRALLRLGEDERGVAAIERSVALAPDNVLLLAELGQSLLQVERWEEAEQAWQMVAEQAPDADGRRQADHNRRLARARGFEQAQEHESALAEYEALLQDTPASRALEIRRGHMLLALGRDALADAAFDRLLEQRPEDVAFRLELAALYQQYERPERREQMLREVVELAPDHVEARAELGRYYLETARLEEGLEQYEAAFESLRQMDPQQPQVIELVRSLTGQMIRLGRGLTGQGLFDQAESVLQRLIGIQPANGQAHYWLSQVYHEQEAYDREAQQLEEVVALMPGNVLMERRLGFAYVNADMAEQAEAALGGVLEAFPFDSEVRYRLAGLYRRQGDDQRADAEYARLLELNPTEEWRLRALDRLGLAQVETHLAQDEPAPALAILRRILALTPDDPLVNLALARSYHQAGRLDEAEVMYQRVLTLAPADPGAQLGLARLHADSDREPQAIEHYHEVATADPLLPQAAEARAELDAILLRKAQRELAAVADETDPLRLEERLLPIGVELFELEGREAALEIFEHLIALAPDSAPAHYWLGRIYLQSGRGADATVVLRHSTDLDPDNADYLKALGQAYREEQLFRLAGQAFEQAQILAPDDITILFELADLHQQRGELDRAREVLLQVMAQAPDDADIERALTRLGLPVHPDRLEDARLDQARELLGPLPVGQLQALAANFYLAMVYQRTQRPAAEIEAAWQAVLAQDPAHPVAGLGLGRLYRETGRPDQALILLQRVADGDGDARLRGEAHALMVEILSERALALAGRLDRGEAEPAEALNLGQTLIQRRAFDSAVTLLEAAAAQSPDDPQAYYWLGRALRFSGHTGPALAALARSAELAPGNLHLHHELGIAYQEANALEEAVAIFDQVEANSEDAAQQREARKRAGQVRALQFTRAGNHPAALREIDALLSEFPRDVTLLGERGRLLLLLDELDEADRTFEHILAIAPQSIGIRMRLAGIYRTRGEAAKFLEQLATVIAIAPDSPEATRARAQLGYTRGIELMEAEDLPGAQEIFERMLTVVPNDPVTRFQLGRVYQQQGMLGEAEMQFTRVVAADPENQQAHLLLGRMYEALERWDNAILAYERAVDLDPETREGRDALTQLAGLYGARIQEMVAAGRTETAIQGLRRLIDNAPGNVAARMQLARLHMNASHFDDALAELREVVRIQPAAIAWRLMGAIYQETGQPRQTAEAFAHAIALEDDEAQASSLAREVVLAVARQMLAENRPFAAIRHLQALHDSRLGSERSWFMLGAIYRQQGQLDDAIRAMREAVRLAPDNTTLRFNLAEMYQRVNDQDLALIQYRDILRRGEPGERIVEESRRRAEFLRDRLALFSSQLSISLVAGETVIQEQDITDTGALNSTLSSQLFYNLGTNFRPTDHMTLRLDTGFSYIGNYSSQVTSLIPRLGVVGNLDYSSLFWRASAHVSENWDLRSETHLARSYNVTVSGGIRFTDPFALFRGWGRERGDEFGEPRLQRAPVERPRSILAPPADNPGLRSTLREIYRGWFVEGVHDDQWLEREESVRMSVESVMALYREGQRLQRQGRLDAALAQYQQVLDIVEDDPLVHLGIGMIQQQRQDTAAAEASLRKALEDDIAGIPARLRLAELHADQGRFGEAITLMEPLVQAGDELTEREYAREQQQTWRSRQQLGIGFEDAYRAALDAEGLARALADIEQGRYPQALATLESLLVAYPDDPLVWLNIGVAHQRLDQGTRAEAAFQRVIDADTRNLNARLRLGMLYGETGQVGQAITLLQRVASDGEGLEIGVRATGELERLERVRLRSLTGEEIERGTPSTKALQWRLFFTDTELPVTSLTETFSYGAGLTFNYSSVDYGNWSLNYTLGVRDNKETLGTDYAYLWHDYGLSWQTPVPNFRGLFGPSENVPGLSAMLSVTRQVRDYLNVDTNALNVFGRQAHRRHVTNSFSAGLNYTLPGQDRMSVSLNYSLGKSDTNLPVGILFSPDGVPIAFQSSGLGAFDTSFISLGLNFRF